MRVKLALCSVKTGIVIGTKIRAIREASIARIAIIIDILFTMSILRRSLAVS